MKSCQNFSQRTYPSTPLNPKLMFHSVLYYFCALAPFGCVTKLSAKRVKLMKKFVPWSCVGIFRNESTRSTALDPKLTFWCVSYNLGALGTVWLPHETWCKTGRASGKVRATKSLRNFLQLTHLIHPIGPWTDILVRFVLFGCILDHLVSIRILVENGPN